MTTALKRGALEDAWDPIKNDPTPDLRAALRALETKARKAVAGGSLGEVGANGRRSVFSLYGPGQLTPVQAAEGWRELIDMFDASNDFLVFCATYGLDPAQVELNGLPDPLPPAVTNPTTPTSADIFQWMFDHLIPITECQSDYGWLRVPPGLAYA